MKLLKKGLTTAVVFALLTPAAFADIIETDAVKVTVNRMEQEIHETNVSVGVVTEEEIRRNPQATLAEQLSRIPGVTVADGGMAGLPRISIRGEGPSRVLVLIDGVRISDQKSMSGTPLLIDPADIERIEVIKGPASVLYGSEAIGGAINIITKKGGNKPIGGTLQLMYDSSTDNFEPYASVSGRYEGFNYHVSGTYADAGDRDTPAGKITGTGFKNQNYTAMAGYEWDKGSVYAQYDYYKSKIEVGTMVLDPWERSTYKAGGDFKNFSDILLKVSYNVFFQNTLKEQISGTSMYVNNDMDSYGGSLQTDWLLFDDHYVIFGADWIYDDLDTITNISMMGVTSSTIADGQESNLGIFLQDEWSIMEQLKLIGGVRYTWIKSKATDSRLGKNDSSDSNWVANVGVVYTPIKELALRANVSQGYKAANLSQKYMGNFAGTLEANADLDPEKSTNYEIGLRYKSGGWNIDAAVYYADAEDYITSTITRVVGSTTYRQYTNVDSAQTLGFELGIDYTFEPLGLTPYAVFNWMHRETKNFGYKTSNTGYPDFTGQLGVKWERELFEHHTFFADLNYMYNSRTKEDTISETTRVVTKYRYPSWGTVNLAMGFESHRPDCLNYFGTLALRNIFDKEYTEANNNNMSAGFHAIATVGITF